MQYEWYIDVYFIVNFAMDLFLLILLGKLLKRSASAFRLMAAGAFGALGSCAAVCFWRFPAVITWVMGLLLPGCIMVWIAFRPKTWRSLVKMVLLLFFEAFCIGGIMEALYQRTKASLYGLSKGMPVLIWFFLAMGAWFGFRFIWTIIWEMKKESQTLYLLTLKAGQVQTFTTGYLDTGNSLYDPSDNRPVHIVSENLWKKLWSPDTDCKRIPFRTIGNPLGILDVMEIEQIEIQKEGGAKKRLSKPLIARAPFKMTKDGSYEVLLHKETLY